MFVELPVKEAYASLYAALQRLAIVLLAASIFAVLAGIFLARRMVGPIQALRTGAERIGSGDFAQRISIKTGDELEGLANQFNDMGVRLQESYADLENKVEQRTAQLSETLRTTDRNVGSPRGYQFVGGRTGARIRQDARKRDAHLRRQLRHMNLYSEGGFRTVALYNAPEAYVPPSSHKVINPHPHSGLGTDRAHPSGFPCRRYPDSSAIHRGQSQRSRAGRPCRGPDACDRADAQGRRADRRYHDLPAGGQAVHRQADRTGRELRQPGGDRDRERSPAQRIARTHHTSFRFPSKNCAPPRTAWCRPKNSPRSASSPPASRMKSRTR